MAEAPSAKRQRTNTIGGAVPGLPDYITTIELLPFQILRNIVAFAAQQHPDVATRICEEHNRIKAAEQAKTIDFDHYSKSAWRSLNVTYSKLSGSNQYEFAGEAVSSVKGCINSIGKATPAHASFGTKKSALETLRKIGKSICLSSTDTLGHEVVKDFQHQTCLEKTMLRIAKSLTAEERQRVLTRDFHEKLVELEGLGAGQCVFEKLGDVRRVLLGGDHASSEVDEEEDEDEDEDEDEENEEEEEEDEEEDEEDEDEEEGNL